MRSLQNQGFNRRSFLKLAGGATVALASASVLPRLAGRLLEPAESTTAQDLPPDLRLAGTDGWIYLPPSPAIPPYHPDNLAPPPFTTYIFGFRNVTGLTEQQVFAQKMKAQHAAPMFWVNEGSEFRLQLTNLGLAVRPDLVDAHTVHWHGFRNAIPFFDGEPHGSLSVNIGKSFTYIYRPVDPGTYMYHCHVEDVEHVHMGMTGLVWVNPAQNGNTALYPSGKFAYNDGDGSTGFDREFGMLLTEVWTVSHWSDAHIQLPEWSDYHPEFFLLNGRTYPDTIAPNGAWTDPANPTGTDANGDLLPTAGYERLQYQPISSLVRANSGERVLLRFANLGFKAASLVLPGIKMKVVGEDAGLLRGRDGTDQSYETNLISLGPGESADVIFTAPPYQGPGPYDRYFLYNRAYGSANNLEASGLAGQATEVWVYPPGALPPQTLPNT